MLCVVEVLILALPLGWISAGLRFFLRFLLLRFGGRNTIWAASFNVENTTGVEMTF